MLDLTERRPIKGFDKRYKVDGYGNVYSLKRDVATHNQNGPYVQRREERVIKDQPTHKGYRQVRLVDNNNKWRTRPVHRLVAEAFIPNPNNYPMVNHKDEDKTNNRADNLEWCDNRYNVTYGTMQDRRRKAMKKYYEVHDSPNKGKPSPKRIPVLGKKREEEEWRLYPSMTHASRELGVNYESIRRICTGRVEQTRQGYIFKFASPSSSVRPQNYEEEEYDE